MKITLQNGKHASEAALRALEVLLGCPLSESFRGFSLSNDGATPETNTFKISDKNESGINRFIPVQEIQKERAHIENIPERAYPVGWAEGGNYVFIDEDKGGAVFFWDHEIPEQITKLEADFGSFLELLIPFDIKSVKLKPGQVKKAWIDPDFFKKINK